MKREFDLRPLDDLSIEIVATVAVRYQPHATLFIINQRLSAKFREYFRHYAVPNDPLAPQTLFGTPLVVR